MRDKVVRILHLVPADGIGGVEIAAKSMAARTDLPCVFKLLFIEPVLAPRRSVANAIQLARANAVAFRAARRFAPDVVICSLWRSVPLALALKTRNRRIRLVYFLHLEAAVHRPDEWLSRLAMKRADQIWADSQATLTARNVPPARGRVISFVTGRADVPTKTFAGPSFVSWGRLHRQKGFDRAIRLIGELVRQGIDARYDIYGPDGGEREALAALIVQLRLGDHVRLHGPSSRDDLPAIAARHSFFLQLSRAEGMCMAAVEAMQFGLVPVATAVGEMQHYVVSDETGVIVDPDDIHRGSKDVAMLISNPERWRRLSIAARRYWRDRPLYADDICSASRALAIGGAKPDVTTIAV